MYSEDVIKNIPKLYNLLGSNNMIDIINNYYNTKLLKSKISLLKNTYKEIIKDANELSSLEIHNKYLVMLNIINEL